MPLYQLDTTGQSERFLVDNTTATGAAFTGAADMNNNLLALTAAESFKRAIVANDSDAAVEVAYTTATTTSLNVRGGAGEIRDGVLKIPAKSFAVVEVTRDSGTGAVAAAATFTPTAVRTAHRTGAQNDEFVHIETIIS